MSFNYSKHKHDDQGHFWASYSDLLLGMSVVFLLLYVTASVRSGTSGIQSQLENQKLSREVQDLKNQLKAYESIKQDYLAKQATKDEEQEYLELMDKLTLLQDETKQERSKLKEAMNEQAKKEKALNQYQQLVRNIINANTLAKTKIAKRNVVIQDQDAEISEKEENIKNLNQEIAQNQAEMSQTQKELETQTEKLKQALRAKKITQAAYENQLSQLKAASSAKVQELQSAADQIRQQLESAESQVASLNSDLAQTKSALTDKESQIEGLKQSYADQAAKDRAEFEAALNKEKLGAAERAAREAQFKERAAAKERELGDKISALSGKLKDTEGALGKLQAEAEARKRVSEDIKKAFAKQGIKADVNANGDVVLDFGEHHFASDSARLKDGMIQILERAMPTYAKSLFSDKKIASKVTSVEIVGFASPTYKGKFIDPSSEVARDKEALAYNMDLSYRRAKSIYEYSFHNSRMSFEHQKTMLPLVKVSARSYLELFDERRRPSNFAEYCKSNDCNKARKVMIKFTMDSDK